LKQKFDNGRRKEGERRGMPPREVPPKSAFEIGVAKVLVKADGRQPNGGGKPLKKERKGKTGSPARSGIRIRVKEGRVGESAFRV